MMALIDNQVQDLYFEAKDAAEKAAMDYLDTYGEGPMNCGFAWVTIKPARGPLVKYMKSINAGSKGYEGGYQVWNPSGLPTQDMSAKETGAYAFATILRNAGIDCSVGSRLD